MSVLRKETPASRLPRYGIHPIVLAEREGFDDGYFGNERKEFSAATAMSSAYENAYEKGQAQREEADAAGGKRKKRKVKR